MKKAGIISIVLSINIFAGNYIDEASVPQAVVQKFHEQFSNAQNITWFQEDNIYQAVSTQQGNEFEVFYNKKAKCIEADRKISLGDLPANAQEKIKKEFGDTYHISSVYIIDKKEAKPIFRVRVRQGKLTYDMEFQDTNMEDLAFHQKIIS